MDLGAAHTHQKRDSQSEEFPLTSLKDNVTKDRGSSRSLRIWTDTWWPELVSWLIGTLAIATIVALLAAYQSKSLSSWMGKVRINTVIAVLAQVTQSALLVTLSSCIGQLKWLWFRNSRAVADIQTFDSASRGPGGSFLLLCKLTRWHLVSLGAVTTVLMFTLPSFAQQAVRTDATRPILFGPGTAQRSLQYRETEGNFQGYAGSQGNYTIDVPSVTKASLLNSWYSQRDLLSEIPASCPTSNCTWDDYITMSVCPTILEDVTSSIISNCSQTDTSRVCTHTIEGVEPGTVAPLLLDQYSSHLAVGPVYENTTAGVKALRPGGLVEFYMLWKVDEQDVYRANATVAAMRGSLGLCLETLQTKTLNSTTKTTSVKQNADVVWRSRTDGDFDDVATDHNGVTYALSSSALSNLRNYLANSIFNGSASVGYVAGGDTYYSTEFMLGFAADVYGNLSATESLQSRLQNLSTGIGNVFRSSPLSDVTEGQAWEVQQYIEVEFEWLTVPLLLLLSTTVFMFATMYRTKQTSMPLWKSSQLAVLQCNDASNMDETMGAVSTMEHRAGMSHYWLSMADGRSKTWRLERSQVE